MVKIIFVMLAGVLAESYGSVSDIEILLLLISSIGFIFSLYNIREAWKDWRFRSRLGEEDHGPHYSARMVVAWNSLRAEIARAIIQFYFITLAALAMTIAEAPMQLHQPTRIVLFGFIFRWGFILSSILLTLKSYWGYQVRMRVLEHYDDEDKNGKD